MLFTKNKQNYHTIAKTVNENQCQYPAANECPHYMELFGCCTKPSIECKYRGPVPNKHK